MSDMKEYGYKKLTKWVNEPTVSDLQQTFKDASSDQDVFMSKLRKWRDNFDITGSARIKTRPGNSKHVPRTIRKQAEWRYPTLSEPFLSNENIFKIYPTTGKDKERARQNELVLNYQFNHKIDKVKFIDELVRASVEEGTVVVRVGWDTKEEQVTRMEPVYTLVPDPERKYAQRYERLLMMLEEDAEIAKQYLDPGIEMALDQYMRSNGNLCSIPQISSYKEITETKETINHPALEVCDLDNIVVDPTCGGDLDKASFIIFSFESSLSELRKRKGTYSNLDKIKDTTTSPNTDPDYNGSADNSSFQFNDKARKKVVVREYWGEWDTDNSGVTKHIVAAWVGDVMIRMEENPYPDKSIPFVFIPYMPKRKSAFGEPDGELLEDNQKIIGALTRGMIDLLGKSANGQTGIRKDLLDITNKRKFLRGEDYEFNPIADPRQAIYTHTYPEISGSAYNLLTIQTNEAESLTGVKAFNNGMSSQAYGEVAAGIKGVLDATSLRDSSILRRLTAGMKKIARRIIAMNAEFLSEEEVIRVTDDEFVTVRRDDLAGEFDIKIEVSTAEEDNKRAEELAYMLQTLGNNVDPQILFMILADIARLRRMPRLAEKLEHYQPQPDPMQQQLQQLEMEKLLSEIQKNYAQAQQYGMSAEHDRAKVVTEQTIAILNQAKAKLLGSQADLQDLDFLEQESGVKQERDLQKIGRQAETQTQMKIIEAALKQAMDTTPTRSRA